MDAVRTQEVEQQNEARQRAEESRKAALLATDFSQVQDFEKLYDAMSVADIKLLDAGNASFRDRVKQADAQAAEVQNVGLITKFRSLPPTEQRAFYDSLLPYQKAIIDADYDRFTALTPEQQQAELGGVPAPNLPASTEADEQARVAALQAEADRLAAEAASANVVPAAPVEELYDGIEKLGENSYKLTVDPGDGSPEEIFYGTSQKECFKALRKSKANATKELRRRRKKIEITNDLKLLGEKVDYAPLVEPLILTPDQIFTLTERQKELKEQLDDPTTVLKATRELNEITEKFRLASLTPEDCERINRPEINRRYVDQHNTAARWVKEHPEFYSGDPQNIEEMKNFLIAADWAVTEKNLDLAFKTLKDQGALSEPPEDEPSSRPPVAQPASVVPVATVAAIPPAPAPASAAPAIIPPTTPPATTGALPADGRVLRPASSSTAAMPTRRIESVSMAAPQAVLTVEMYNNMPAAEAKRRYLREPEFKAAVDKLMAEGKI